MENRKENLIENTMQRKVIYVYEKDYVEEQGFLKVGDASIDRPNANLEDNSDYLMSIAEKRIREYEHTSPINILYVTYAVTNDKTWASFRDHQVHEVLRRSGVTKVKKGKSTEWFETDIITVKMAIDAVKQGKSYINIPENKDDRVIINFRPEQEEAIEKTIKVYKKQDEMLWNAKMRFGKTLSALELTRRSKFKKTLIITHRPIVNEGWYEDFGKIFDCNDTIPYLYGSKSKGEEIEYLLSGENPFIYFASIQDLRGSKLVNKKKGIEKNLELFNVKWDFIIIDEAHEGTTTDQAEEVMNVLKKKNTKVLKLSGTPFNLLDEYDESQIYTWDYVMEQEAKKNWDIEHMGDSNPYGALPEMCMYVYELGNYIKNSEFYDIETSAFNFAEFFKTNDEGKFIHEQYVWSFLNLISRSEDYSKDLTYMPFSTTEIRNELKHTLWTLPSINATKALEIMLKRHPVFHSYNIANLTDESGGDSDLEKIRNAITDNPESTQSITLTVRRGTVGTTVKEWTGILVLNNTESASNYLQSIFRVQSPYTGKEGIKEKAYVFDFAPDRSLKMVSQAAKLNIKAGSINGVGQEIQMTKFLNFLPIIGIDGQKMSQYDVKSMLMQLKRAQAERAVRNGFDDTSIYNDELLRLSDADLSDFANLQKIVGNTKQTKHAEKIDINKQGLTEEEWEKSEQALSKKGKSLSKEEEEALKKRKDLSKQRNTMISVLRGISIRIPLMIYGLDIDIEEDVTIDNFVSQVDDISWNEFMPKGITKGEFVRFKKYYDADVFIEAGSRIRRTALAADKLSVEERIDKIASIFSAFKNPDKETVLTPWRVVNMHLGEIFGGYNFFDEKYNSQTIRYITQNTITDTIFSEKSKILEINSKTGLYPLYMAYNIYKKRWVDEQGNWNKNEWIKMNSRLWDDVLQNNIFVINKTPMARTITYRTLNGYQKNESILNNLMYIENLENLIREDRDSLSIEVEKQIGDKNMKFDAIIGNPPYQEVLSSETAKAKQLFPHFIMNTINMNPKYVSLITPARWYAGKGQDGSFLKLREFAIENSHFRKMYFYPNANDVFDSVQIKGGINFFLYESKYDGKVEFTVVNNNSANTINRELFVDGIEEIITNNIAISILEKVNAKKYKSLTEITTGRDAFGISGKTSNIESLVSQVKKGKQIQVRCMNESIVEINENNVKKNIEIMKAHKVFISKSAGDPKKDKKVIGKPYLSKPGEACTDTFIPIGKFNSEYEALNLEKYLQTKFLRYIISTIKTSQNVYQNVYKLVPLLDFANNAQVDWSNSIADLDLQLYKHFNLSVEEINEIESTVENR